MAAAPAPRQRCGPLQPFSAEPHLRDLRLEAEARISDTVLELRFRLSGPLDPILLPAASADPQRRDELWQSTCFEAFLALDGRPGYWELNLAPSGDWNLYTLSDYRQGLRPEPRVNRLAITSGRQLLEAAGGERFELGLQLDLAALLPAGQPLLLSATAVLEHRDQGCSYWAWRHAGREPDFHRRESLLTI